MPRTSRRFKRRGSRRFSRRIRKRPILRRRRGRRTKQLLWPNSQLVKFRYCDTDTPSIAIAAGTSAQKVEYKINSMYDINSAIASTTVPGYTEYTQMYGTYRVLGVKIKTTFLTNSDVTTPFNVGIIMHNTQLAGIGWTDWQRYLRSNRHCVTSTMTSQKPVTLSLYRKLGTVWGDKRQYLSNDGFSGGVGANPSLLLYGYVVATLPTTSTFGANTACVHKTEITLYTKMYRRDAELE